MADAANRWPENAPGRYYVDRDCTFCDVCTPIAPDHFRYNEGAGGEEYVFVYRQPATPEEEALCAEALQACPMGAIGDDGP